MTEPMESIAFCHACGSPMDVAAVAPFANVACPHCGQHTRVKREFGRYTLLRRHAVGGMSMVFAALDHTLEREVAVKILSETYSSNERRITAFAEEARITASFSHPNVVRVLTTGRAFGRFYIAMEFVPGGHFEHQIHTRGKIPELDVLPLAIEVAHGLRAAHAAGLIHRDVKPGNILLDADGHAKLVDFGLALVTQGGQAQATELWATPYYVPPETIVGAPEDFRSDIYAFGATLYHALAGKPPCNEESMATDVLSEAKKRVVPLSLAAPSISAAICRIVERAMAYDPQARFASYDEMIERLESVLTRLKSGCPETVETAATRRKVKNHRARITQLTAGCTALAAIAIAIAYGSWKARPKPPPSVVAAPATPPAPVSAAGVDSSAEIMKCYLKARAAVTAREFQQAANDFTALSNNPAVQEPTRTWAGVEAVLAHFLNGQATDARQQAHATLDHARTLPPATPAIGQELLDTLTRLEPLPPLSPPNAPPAGASQVIATMLAGLKNWHQGMPTQAAECFHAVAAAKLDADNSWTQIYQDLARDYLSDHQILTGLLFAALPTDKNACDTIIHELDATLPKLKTRGRAKFNVRAWQLDLARQAKLLAPSH